MYYCVGITTECVADLPESLRIEKEIGIIYMDIKTESGIFRDAYEVDSDNITEYMVGGEKKAKSVIPTANDYRHFFKKQLEEYDEIVHISISGGVSDALENAKLGRAKLGMDGRKIHLVDSGHLSSGTGLLVLEAAKYREDGMSATQIVAALNDRIPHIRTSFMANNAEYLYYNGQVKKWVKELCQILQLHPILQMKNGKLGLQGVYIGKYEKAAFRYIKNTLKIKNKIRKDRAFITYVGCSHALLQSISNKVGEYIEFDELVEQKASATIASNSGPLTFGILYATEN